MGVGVGVGVTVAVGVGEGVTVGVRGVGEGIKVGVTVGSGVGSICGRQTDIDHRAALAPANKSMITTRMASRLMRNTALSRTTPNCVVRAVRRAR
jgi:hypothetical protein